MSNIIQHYSTWKKKHCIELGKGRRETLSLHGFHQTVHTILPLEHDSPVQHAAEIAENMIKSDAFDCDAVHLVLVNAKNMDGNTGYLIYRKLIKR